MKIISNRNGSLIRRLRPHVAMLHLWDLDKSQGNRVGQRYSTWHCAMLTGCNIVELSLAITAHCASEGSLGRQNTCMNTDMQPLECLIHSLLHR